MPDVSPTMIKAGADAWLYDADVFSDPPSANWLEAAPRVESERAGRGQIHLLETPAGIGVHRAYRRGGRIMVLFGDRYLFSGLEQSRPIREFRLLATLSTGGLPVPKPLLARVRRNGMVYRGDLLTAAIPDTETLAEFLRRDASSVPWPAVMAAIAAVHHANVWHADLNAHNVLIDRHGKSWVIDFDRAEVRAPKLIWREENLERLRQSLHKIQGKRWMQQFEPTWQQILDEYAHAFAALKRARWS